MDILSEIVKLSKRFISINSVSGNSKALDEILELALSKLKGFTIEEFNKGGIKSALIYNSIKRPKKFNVILNGHLDVIPGRKHKYNPKIVGDKLYGVGSMDMKSNVACLIMVFKEVAKKVDYPLALQLVTDEQTGSLNGTKHQINKGIGANFVIAGETSNFKIVNKAKGIIWLKVSAKGKTAHSAYPWQGENSIWEMDKFLSQLKKKYPTPTSEAWKTTVNVSNIETNNFTFNKIPNDCVVWLDVRYIPEDEGKIMDQLKSLIPKNFNLEIFFEEPSLFVKGDNEYIKSLQKSASEILKHKISLHSTHGTSDTTYFARAGCPAVEFGPVGSTGNIDNEFVNIPSLRVYYEILTTFLLNLNG